MRNYKQIDTQEKTEERVKKKRCDCSNSGTCRSIYINSVFYIGG